MSKINVQGTDITVLSEDGKDFICLTDMLKQKDGEFFITDWLRNKNTLDYISVWERLNNPGFNYGEFAIITNGAGRNSFKISVKDLTENAILNPSLLKQDGMEVLLRIKILHLISGCGLVQNFNYYLLPNIKG